MHNLLSLLLSVGGVSVIVGGNTLCLLRTILVLSVARRIKGLLGSEVVLVLIFDAAIVLGASTLAVVTLGRAACIVLSSLRLESGNLS